MCPSFLVSRVRPIGLMLCRPKGGLVLKVLWSRAAIEIRVEARRLESRRFGVRMLTAMSSLDTGSRSLIHGC